MSKRLLAIGLASFFALVVVLPPFINVNRYRGSIASSVGQALGRDVSVGQVSLRLWPQPGFKLDRVVIGEDPEFGYEPMLRADAVTASLRLISLWRGRLEIARLSLDSGADINPPSLNLVRSADGRWNIESLLERTRSIPAAPTAATRPESRPRFPYIEANGGRINFKFGAEKKIWALTNADFALWLASESEWRMRLTASPMRTDANLSNTGEIRINGRFRRAANLRDTPVDFKFYLKDSQLGQLTSLIYGRDRGWRGSLNISGSVKGTPGSLHLTLQGGINDFRRYDIATLDTFNLGAKCSAHYSSASQQISAIDCGMPIGEGQIRLLGQVEGLLGPRAYEVMISASQVPVRRIVSFVRHAKRDLPDDLDGIGDLNASITVRKTAEEFMVSVDGGTTPVSLSSSIMSSNLDLPALKFAMEGPNTAALDSSALSSRRKRNQLLPKIPAMRLAVEPFSVGLGGATKATASAWFAGKDFQVDVKGEARLARLSQVAMTLGLAALPVAEGNAKLDLVLAGKWAGFIRPLATGSVQLRDVTAKVNGVAAPLKISTANLLFAPDQVAVSLKAMFSKPRLGFIGSLQLPRGCKSLASCPVQFNLNVDQVSTEQLNLLLNPKASKRPWWEDLGVNRDNNPPLLSQVQASGTVEINHLLLKSLTASKVRSMMRLENGVLTLTGLRAELLGGKHHGHWTADFTGPSPAYKGTGTLDSIAVTQLSELMEDSWASGTANADYTVAMNGWNGLQLLQSATAQIQLDWRGGILRHIALNGDASPFQFKRLTGKLELNKGAFHLAEGKAVLSGGSYEISGTASMGRELKFSLRNGGRTYRVNGTLSKPRVTVVSEKQAALKP